MCARMCVCSCARVCVSERLTVHTQCLSSDNNIDNSDTSTNTHDSTFARWPAPKLHRTSTSARTIATGGAHEMDHFFIPGNSTGFIGNQRLRELRAAVQARVQERRAAAPTVDAQALLRVNNTRLFGVARVKEAASSGLVLDQWLATLQLTGSKMLGSSLQDCAFPAG